MVERVFHIEEISKEDTNQLQTSAEAMARMLSPLEYRIIIELYKSENALSAKAIQKKIVLELILRRLSETPRLQVGTAIKLFADALLVIDKSTIDFWANFSKTSKITGNFIDGAFNEFSLVLPRIPVEKLLKTARAEKIEVPSHTTIANHLDGLCAAGFVGRRALGAGKRAEALYFITPKLYGILKKSEWFQSKISNKLKPLQSEK